MRKHIPNLIFLLSGILLVIYTARAYQDVDRMEPSQIALRYGALFVLVAGMTVRTLLNRRENLSSVNFGFKLMGEGILFLAILAALLKVLFF